MILTALARAKNTITFSIIPILQTQSAPDDAFALVVEEFLDEEHELEVRIAITSITPDVDKQTPYSDKTLIIQVAF